MSSLLPSLTLTHIGLTALAAALLACTGCDNANRLGRELLTRIRPQSQTGQAQQRSRHARKPATGADASHLLARARRALLSRRSVTARMRLRSTAWGSNLAGVGNYLQGPPSSQCARLELVVRSEWDVFSWQQVADGTWLWTHRQFGDDSGLTRAAIPQLPAQEPLEGSAASATSDALAQGGTVSTHTSGGEARCNLAAVPGNLHSLLACIDTYWQLTSLEPQTWRGKPMWLIRGTPRDAAWSRLFGRMRGDAGAVASARRHAIVPGSLRLWLGRQDLFPYRLVLEQAGQESHTFGAPDPPVMLDLELYDVRLDLPLKTELFRYDPGERPFVEVSARYEGTAASRGR